MCSVIQNLDNSCATDIYMLFSGCVVEFNLHVSLQRNVSITGRIKETATLSVGTKHADPVHNNNHENA